MAGATGVTIWPHSHCATVADMLSFAQPVVKLRPERISPFIFKLIRHRRVRKAVGVNWDAMWHTRRVLYANEGAFP